MNHPLGHTVDRGHTLIGKDNNAGEAVGDGLRKESGRKKSGVNEDDDNGGSDEWRTTTPQNRRGVSTTSSSMSKGHNNQRHSLLGSKDDTSPTGPSYSSVAGAVNTATDISTTTEISRASPFPSLDSPVDTERDQVTPRPSTAVQQDPSDPLVVEEVDGDPPLQQQRYSRALRQQVRARTVSTPTPTRGKPLEYLTDMGPLEIGRKVDSGVHLGKEYEQEEVEKIEEAWEGEESATLAKSVSSVRNSTVDTSSYTHGSETSQSSEESSSTSKTTDRETETEGAAWGGNHPLVMDFMAEPDALDDDSLQARGVTPPPSYVQGRDTNLRRKGYTVSVGSQETVETPKPANTRKRRTASKANDDIDWTDDVPHADRELGHGRTMTESAGKRVIIHQLAVTDTLAGIALYYGIQVSVLKKSNKLWTNDSIHTRKYLYIPFEECTVARQAGVMVDEDSQTVILPQRVQLQHGRSRSMSGRASTPVDSTPNNMPTIDESISAVTAALSTDQDQNPPTNSLRVVAWIDPKSAAAPAVSSPTMTAVSLKSDNSLKAAPLSPRRASTIDNASRKTSSASGSAPFSENLPNTVVVPPSMTHEALAARFKEMDLVTSEQQQRKLLNQELRTNPVHQLHRTTDLRQLANLQQPQKQQLLNPGGKRSLPSSNAGSRRASVDIGVSELLEGNGITGPSGRRVSGRGETHLTIDEEDDDHDQQRDFVAYGNQQHIYEPDNLERGGGLVGHPGDIRSEQRGAAGVSSSSLSLTTATTTTATTTTTTTTTLLRRQELITVPAGMLSFFPSPEHSKKLETPQSISKLPDRMSSYHSSSVSSSSTSSGSLRGILQDKGTGTRKKTRASLGEQTFQSPSSSTTTSDHHAVGTSSQQPSYLPTTTTGSSSVTTSTSKAGVHSKTVRVQQPYYSPQKWSLMGESLVDDILGA
ncbi:hypothetical protein BGZ65_004201, partial [Modicella reniformis]